MNLPLHISVTSKYCWIQIPKCASSTLRRILNEKTQKQNESEYEWKKIKYTEDHHFFFNFAFVRNPFERLVSCYSDKIENHKRWSDNKRQSNSIHYMIDRKFTFKQFVKKITSDFEKNDDHWLPCSSFIPSDFEKYGFIGKCENLQSHFDHVCDKIKIDKVKLPQFNKTEHNHYRDYYDAETIETVTKQYACDLKRFNYNF
jgi:hypothetical protein